jgi:hypothetical protein
MVASERVNVFETFPGDPSALGPRDADPFPLREARVLAEKLLDRLVEEAVLSNRVVVLVGAQVAAAFRHRPPFFAWERGVWDGRFYDRACMPHPRGRSRYWNDPEKVAEASAFLRGVFSGVVV